MYTFLVTVVVIASILMVLIVLVQNSKGGGLAANFASGNQTFGVRQTADFLEKTTWTLVAVILGCCIIATAFVPARNGEKKTDLEKTLNTQAPANAQPQFPSGTANGAASQEAPAAEAPATETPAAPAQNAPAK